MDGIEDEMARRGQCLGLIEKDQAFESSFPEPGVMLSNVNGCPDILIFS